MEIGVDRELLALKGLPVSYVYWLSWYDVGTRDGNRGRGRDCTFALVSQLRSLLTH